MHDDDSGRSDADGGRSHADGGRSQPEANASDDATVRVGSATRPTLNTSVRRRRTDRAFYIRLAGAIRQNERALERLKR